MINLVERYSNEHSYLMRTMRTIPFNSARYLSTKTVYWFYSIYSELIRMIDDDYPFHPNIKNYYRFLKDMQGLMAEIFGKIADSGDIDELQKNVEDFYSRAIIPLNGQIRFGGRTFNMIHNASEYARMGYKEEDMVGFVHETIRKLDFGRKEINAITIMGAKENSRDYSMDSGLMNVLLHVKEGFENNNLKNYVVIDDDVTYNTLRVMDKHVGLYEKMIGGSFGGFKISTNFEMGFMGCKRLDKYFYASYEDDYKELLAKINELRLKVAKGGVMFLLMPRIFLNVPVLENIYCYMKNVNIFFGGKENAFAIIAGNRRTFRDKNLSELSRIMRHAAFGEELRCPLDIECPPMAEVRFRGSVPSAEEVEGIVTANSSFLSKFFERATKNLELKTEEETRHPLIPFGPGQLGLVLVSGKIDGIVDEGNGVCHLIKGSARIETNQRSYMADGVERTVELVTSTGVSVDVLTANGTHISLD